MRVWTGPLAWEPSIGGSMAWRIPGGRGTVLDLRPFTECGTRGEDLVSPPSSVVMVTDDDVDLTTVSDDYEQIASDPDETLSLARRQALKALTGSTAPLTALRLRQVLYELLTEHADPDQDRCTGALLPARRRLALHCGPISVTRAFDFSGPEWPLVQQTLHRQYRILRLRALAGNILQRHPETGQHEAVPDFHRRFLTVLLEKFRLAVNAENAARFIPGDLSPEDPLPHSTSISDNFNGSDNAALGIQLAWTETSGDHFDNNTNRGRQQTALSADSEARADSDLSTTDHSSQIKGFITNGWMGACTRFSSSARTYMLAYVGFNGGGSEVGGAISKVVTGTRTDLDSDAGDTAVSGDTVALESDGTSHTQKLNGSTTNGPHTDSSITTGTRGGVFLFLVSMAGGNTFDDFSASDLAAGGSRFALTRC